MRGRPVVSDQTQARGAKMNPYESPRTESWQSYFCERSPLSAWWQSNGEWVVIPVGILLMLGGAWVAGYSIGRFWL